MDEKPTLTFTKNVGIEIECPFSFYYPDLWQKYFDSGKKKYYDIGEKEKAELQKELDEREPLLFEKLTTATKELNLKRGRDKYWEFIFPATKEGDKIVTGVNALVSQGFLPEDIPLSFQITVGDIGLEHAHAVLFFLEKSFLTKARIEEAFTETDYIASWGRKGGAGITMKHATQLEYGDTEACELRTLKIAMKDAGITLGELKSLLEREPKELIDEARGELESLGLPWKKWGKEEFKSFGEKLGR